MIDENNKGNESDRPVQGAQEGRSMPSTMGRATAATAIRSRLPR